MDRHGSTEGGDGRGTRGRRLEPAATPAARDKLQRLEEAIDEEDSRTTRRFKLVAWLLAAVVFGVLILIWEYAANT